VNVVNIQEHKFGILICVFGLIATAFGLVCYRIRTAERGEGHITFAFITGNRTLNRQRSEVPRHMRLAVLKAMTIVICDTMLFSLFSLFSLSAISDILGDGESRFLQNADNEITWCHITEEWNFSVRFEVFTAVTMKNDVF
jgi:hypothetical protein